MKRTLNIVTLLTVLVLYLLPVSISAALHLEPDAFHMPYFSGLAINTAAYSGASDWAVPELDKAAEYGLITPRIKSNMMEKVTREEFAEIALKLYEKYTGKTAPQGNVRFSDTTNPDILKAANLGLVQGVGGNRYAPSELVTREQMATILLRAIKVINPAGNYQTQGAAVFADDDRVEAWAREGVYYCYKVQIVKGVGKKNGADRFDPDGDATREQAVLVSLRAYELLAGESSLAGNGAGTGVTSGEHPSQSKRSLPKGFPKNIPFTDDAYNINKEVSADSIFLNYQSNQSLKDTVALYGSFITQFDRDCQEIKDETYCVFTAEMPGYELILMIADTGNIMVSMTLNFPEGIPDEPENGENTTVAGMDDTVGETNQQRLNLPAFLPADIPFTDDAVLSGVDDKSYALAREQMITVTYNTQKDRNAVIDLYKSFTRSKAEENNEINLGDSYSFNTVFSQYEMQLLISENYTGTGSQVSFTVKPQDGVFMEHYAKTDYSDGVTDNSGVTDLNAMNPGRLVAGPTFSDPYSTNLFIRKDDKSLWGFGNNLYTGAVEDEYGWKPVKKDATWTRIDQDAYCLDTESDNYFVLKPDKSLWTYGSNHACLLGNGEDYLYGDYLPSKILDNVRTANIGQIGIAVKTDNTLWTWGFSSPVFSVLEQPESDRLVPEKVMDNVVDAVQSGSLGSLADDMIMVLKTDGSVWTWGEGNCGDGGVTPGRKTPIKVMNGVKKIEASHSLCCMIKNDNSLWVWQAHITGSGLAQNLTSPVKIMDGVREVSPGERFLLALKNDGTVWAFGDNTYGKCGIGSLTPEYLSSPVKILDGAVEISATDHNAFAFMKDGRILGWGLNEHDWLDTDEWRILVPTDIGFTTYNAPIG